MRGRTNVIRAALVLAAGLALSGCRARAEAGPRPVLLITIDTLRSDFVGPEHETPALREALETAANPRLQLDMEALDAAALELAASVLERAVGRFTSPVAVKRLDALRRLLSP